MNGHKIFLRALEPTDLTYLSQWNFDAVTSRYFSPRLPVSEYEQSQWFHAQTGSDRKKLMICEKESSLPVGLISLMRIDHINKQAETGMTIGEKSALRKGYAGEALGLLLRFAFESWNFHRIYARVLDENIAAQQFYLKNHFTIEGRERDSLFWENRYHDVLCYSLLKTEFEPHAS
jgi:RimJ/RimL family protein N-acetyltransferase